MERTTQLIKEQLRYHIIGGVGGRVKLRISDETKAKLMKAGYGIYNHSTVELCHWTRSALPRNRVAISSSSMEHPQVVPTGVLSLAPWAWYVAIGAFIAGDRPIPSTHSCQTRALLMTLRS